MMELSKRLQAVADLAGNQKILADVGTDHGYIPIYMVEQGRCEKAFAMDVNQGPLLRAKEHISQHGLDDKISLRLSDGVKALQVGECTAVVVAGMGGALAIKIMEEGKQIFRSLDEFVLQPQSELDKVRLYLQEQGYCIVDEDMVLEDGKFYPMMKVKVGTDAAYTDIELLYGRQLLQKKSAVLKQFLMKELHTKQLIMERLSGETGEHILTRKKQIRQEMECVMHALEVYQ